VFKNPQHCFLVIETILKFCFACIKAFERFQVAQLLVY